MCTRSTLQTFSSRLHGASVSYMALKGQTVWWLISLGAISQSLNAIAFNFRLHKLNPVSSSVKIIPNKYCTNKCSPIYQSACILLRNTRYMLFYFVIAEIFFTVSVTVVWFDCCSVA